VVKKQREYRYEYADLIKVHLMYLFCCCFKQRSWYQYRKKRHDDFISGYDRLKNEVDLM